MLRPEYPHIVPAYFYERFELMGLTLLFQENLQIIYFIPSVGYKSGDPWLSYHCPQCIEEREKYSLLANLSEGGL